MIHQHIFASPKPGLSEAEFHTYWREVHAGFVIKIPQIRRYRIDTRILCAGVSDPPVWNGCAEIWLSNEEEQLASLQSDAFIHGARIDEPNWAAFWNTLALDTDSKVMRDDPSGGARTGVKLITLIKRRWGDSVPQFRRRWAECYAPLLLEAEGVGRYLQCTTRDVLYTLGEPRFDGLHQIWCESLPTLELVLHSRAFRHAH
jgi:uncharacterized protein (TIGR02118 family)